MAASHVLKRFLKKASGYCISQQSNQRQGCILTYFLSTYLPLTYIQSGASLHPIVFPDHGPPGCWIKHFQCSWVKVESEIVNNSLQRLTLVLTHATTNHFLWLIKTTERELDKIHPHEWAFQASHQVYLITNHSEWICDLGSLTNQSTVSQNNIGENLSE